MIARQLQKTLGLRAHGSMSAHCDASVLIIGQTEVRDAGIDFDGIVQVDGSVEGDVRCKRLVVTASGRIDGAIVARAVHADGTVNGPIEADRVFLGPTALVKGNITYEALNIATGASVSGICRDRCRTKPLQLGEGAADSEALSANDMFWAPSRKGSPIAPARIAAAPANGGARSMRAVWDACQRKAHTFDCPAPTASMHALRSVSRI